MLFRLLRIACIGMLLCITLILLLWAGLIALNLRDQPPSPASEGFSRLLQRDALPEYDNAWVYTSGFAAPAGLDPLSEGRRCMHGTPACPQTRLPIQKPGRQLLDHCRQSSAQCLEHIQARPTQLSLVLEQEAWLLQRYQGLLTLAGWQEPVSAHEVLDMRYPPMSQVIEAQRLWLLQAWQRAGQGQASAAGHQLAQDAAFWRRMLASSRHLLFKASAQAALRQNLLWTNLILRRVTREEVASTLPASWQTPFTADELAMRPALAGEWLIFRSGMHHIKQESLRELPTRDWLPDALAMPLLQPEATGNLYAEQLWRLSEPLDATTPACPDDFRSARLQQERTLPQWSAYNPIGQILVRVAAPDFSRYGARLASLEGGRRALLLLAELRSQGISPEQIPRQLELSELRQPCNDLPYQWDAQNQSLQYQLISSDGLTDYSLYW